MADYNLQGLNLGSNNNWGAYGTARGLAGGYGGAGTFSGFDLGSLRDPNYMNSNTNNGVNWFGAGGILSTIGDLGLLGLQGYTGLKSLSLANKQLGLANQQFDFEKGLANRNLSNQAKTINNYYDAAGQAAIGLLGGIDALTGQTISPDAATVAKANENIKNSYVDGSPINA